MIPVDDGINRRHEAYGDDEEDYDLSPDEDEIDYDEEEDELDALEDPRIIEVGTDEEEEAPKLINSEKKASKKGKNKRPAADSDDEAVGLDDIMAKSLKPAEATTSGETKLSKKQLKKLKNNAGQAVAAETKDAKKGEQPSTDSPNSKKVQFAKNLEQGPSGTGANDKSKAATNGTEEKKDRNKTKASLGVKTVQGVKIDDKKLGSGPAAKKGNKVSMRYIGKLQDGKVFDGKLLSGKLLLVLSHHLHVSSKQERQAFQLQAWCYRSHQGLGHRCRGYVGWWGAPDHGACKFGVWQAKPAGDPPELNPRL